MIAGIPTGESRRHEERSAMTKRFLAMLFLFVVLIAVGLLAIYKFTRWMGCPEI